MRTDFFPEILGSHKVALDTFDKAYSADFFSWYEWQATTAGLMGQGFTEQETEIILCSKITRRARDAYAEGDEGKATYVLRYIEKNPMAVTRLFEE